MTISGITHVIDTGRVKECRFNSSKRLSELVPVWTSQASAIQRCGRAGRTNEGTCWRLYSEQHFNNEMIQQTIPEIAIAPLEEIILQVCLVEEFGILELGQETNLTAIEFLKSFPQSPDVKKLENACRHLFEIGAVVDHSLLRLTPLGWHLAHLPMDTSLGKMLLISVLLGCLEPVLIAAAALSCNKSIFLPSKIHEKCRESQELIVKSGYGGASWKGGTIKGDLLAIIAAYESWESISNSRERTSFAKSHYLDLKAIKEISHLRKQLEQSLVYAGFLCDEESRARASSSKDNAYLVSCCIVAGLSPNIAALVRKKGSRQNSFSKLMTRDGDMCLPASSSFQRDRVKNAKAEGQDAYAVYLSKFCIVHTSNDRVQPSQTLNEVNFVSRFAIILFGGNLDMKGNSIVVDEWLKFKIGRNDDSKYSAYLIHALREEIDNIMLNQISLSGSNTESHTEYERSYSLSSGEVIETIVEMIKEEL